MSDVDKVAKAVCAADHQRNPTWGGEDSWDDQRDYKQDDYRHMAQAAIDALVMDNIPNVLQICGWCMRKLNYCLDHPCDDRKNTHD